MKRNASACKVFLRPTLFRASAWVAVVLLSACAGTRAPVPTDDLGRIEQARANFEAGEYREVILILEGYLASRPGSRYVEEATFLIGRSYYERGLDFEAEDQFHKVLKEFPGGEFSCESKYYLGLALLSQARSPHLDQVERTQARTKFKTFMSTCGEHPLVVRAEEHIKDIEDDLAEKLFITADQVYRKRRYGYGERFYYQRIIDEYPHTKWVAPAMLGMAKSHERDKHWVDAADWAQRLIIAFPESEEADKVRGVLDKAAKHGIVPEDNDDENGSAADDGPPATEVSPSADGSPSGPE